MGAQGAAPGASSSGAEAVDEQYREEEAAVARGGAAGRARRCRAEARALPSPSQVRTPTPQLRAETRTGYRAGVRGAVTGGADRREGRRRWGRHDSRGAGKWDAGRGSAIGARPPPWGWGHTRMRTTYRAACEEERDTCELREK